MGTVPAHKQVVVAAQMREQHFMLRCHGSRDAHGWRLLEKDDLIGVHSGFGQEKRGIRLKPTVGSLVMCDECLTLEISGVN